jgi:hypothetical protein
MNRKQEGFGFVITLLILGWWIGSPAPVEPAEDTAVETVVVPAPPVEKGGDRSPPETVADVLKDLQASQEAADAGGTTPTLLPASASSCSCGGDKRKSCACKRCKCKTIASVSLRDAIRGYVEDGGQRAFVIGKTDWQHLVDEHGWAPGQLRGLNHDELQYLHGASHAGKLSSNQFVAANRNAAPFNPGAAARLPTASGADKLTIHMAPFHCPPCNTVKGYDWQGFDVSWVTGGADAYPTIAWFDKDGQRRVLRGAYSPKRVRWSFDRTME